MRLILAVFVSVIIVPATGHAQCYPDRHSTNWFDGWVSCEPSQRPDVPEEKGHWILYDFGQNYKFGQTHVWNTNDPAHLDWGFREVLFKVSSDGTTWEDAGTATFAEAPGVSIYEGFEGPDLAEVEGRYLLLIGQSNWGGSCYGFGELRITAEEVETSATGTVSDNTCLTVSASPNPVSTATVVTVESRCPGKINYSVTDVLGRSVRAGQVAGGGKEVRLRIAFDDLPEGLYYLHVDQNGQVTQLALVHTSDR